MNCSFKKILTSVLALLMGGVLLSCKETTKGSSEEIRNKTFEKENNHSQKNLSAYTIVDSIQTLDEVERKAFPFNGRFLLSRSWNDKLGHNTFIISEKGNYENGKSQKEIFTYHYVQADSVSRILWQMNDFVDGLGCDLNIQLINFFPLVSDIDSNGIAETAIFYSLNNRCDAVAFPAKLIVHEGTDLFKIRGVREQFLNPPEELNNKYQLKAGLPPIKYKKIETNGSKLDTCIVNFYSRQWDEFISLENKLQGGLPNSLIILIN